VLTRSFPHQSHGDDLQLRGQAQFHGHQRGRHLGAAGGELRQARRTGARGVKVTPAPWRPVMPFLLPPCGAPCCRRCCVLLAVRRGRRRRTCCRCRPSRRVSSTRPHLQPRSWPRSRQARRLRGRGRAADRGLVGAGHGARRYRRLRLPRRRHLEDRPPRYRRRRAAGGGQETSAGCASRSPRRWKVRFPTSRRGRSSTAPSAPPSAPTTTPAASMARGRPAHRAHQGRGAAGAGGAQRRPPGPAARRAGNVLLASPCRSSAPC